MSSTLQAQQRGPALLATRTAVTPDLAKPTSSPMLVAAGVRGRVLLATRNDKRGVVLSATAVAPDLAKPTSVPVLVAAGVRGPAGASSAAYKHDQPSAQSTWIINHNLGYRPSVSLYTVGGVLMLASVQHIDNDQARAFFDGPVAGYAVCS